MSTPTRTAATLAGLLAVALAVVVLAPSGTTLAGWSDREEVVLQPMTTDTVGLAVARTGTATASVTNTAGAAAVTWAPTAVTATAGAGTTPAQAAEILRGLTVGYGTDCAARPRWTAPAGSGATRTVTGPGAPLAAGATGALCQQVVPQDAAALARDHGGRSITLTTQLSATADVARAWTAGAQTDATYRVPFPRPSSLTCRSGSFSLFGGEKPSVLSWTWAGEAKAAQPAVARWELLTLENGTWKQVDESVGGTLTANVFFADFPFFGVSAQPFKVRAYPFARDGRIDTSVYAESDTQVWVTKSGFGTACTGITQPLADPAPALTAGGLS